MNVRQRRRHHNRSSLPHPPLPNMKLIKYTLLPSIPLCIIAILSANPHTWVTSGIHHFYIELLGVITKSLTAAICRRSKRYLVISCFLKASYGALKSKLHSILFYFTADGKYILPKYTSICSSKVVSATKCNFMCYFR
jgi:hypothetical protein